MTHFELKNSSKSIKRGERSRLDFHPIRWLQPANRHMAARRWCTQWGALALETGGCDRGISWLFSQEREREREKVAWEEKEGWGNKKEKRFILKLIFLKITILSLTSLSHNSYTVTSIWMCHMSKNSYRWALINGTKVKIKKYIRKKVNFGPTKLIKKSTLHSN